MVVIIFSYIYGRGKKELYILYVLSSRFLGKKEMRNSWVFWGLIQCNAHFPQKLQASKYWFLQCSNILIGKFEIGRGLFENFGKLEDGFSKFSNIPIFGRNQMNEPFDTFRWSVKMWESATNNEKLKKAELDVWQDTNLGCHVDLGSRFKTQRK